MLKRSAFNLIESYPLKTTPFWADMHSTRIEIPQTGPIYSITFCKNLIIGCPMCRQGNDRSLLETSLPQLYGKNIIGYHNSNLVEANCCICTQLSKKENCRYKKLFWSHRHSRNSPNTVIYLVRLSFRTQTWITFRCSSTTWQPGKVCSTNFFSSCRLAWIFFCTSLKVTLADRPCLTRAIIV